MLLAAGFVVYCGPLTARWRVDLVKTWQEHLAKVSDAPTMRLY